MNTITKAVLAEQLSTQFREFLSAKQAKALIESFIDEISCALMKGESVKFPGLGTFKLREKPARPGRNPRTREPVEIASRVVVTFQVSPKIRTQLRRQYNKTDGA